MRRFDSGDDVIPCYFHETSSFEWLASLSVAR